MGAVTILTVRDAPLYGPQAGAPGARVSLESLAWKPLDVELP